MSEASPQVPKNYSTEKSIWYNKNVQRFGLPVLSALAAVGIAGCSSSESTPVNAGSDRVASATATGETSSTNEITDQDMEDMSASSLASLDTAVRLPFVEAKIEHDFEGTWQSMQRTHAKGKGFSDEEAALLDLDFSSPNLPSNKADYTNAQILKRFAITMYEASIQAVDGEVTAKSIDDGRKMLSVFMSPDNNNYERFYNLLGSGQGGIINVFEEDTSIQFPKLSNTTFDGHEIGEDGRVIKITNTTNNSVTGESSTGTAYLLFTLIQSNDKSEWQFVEEYDGNDASVQNELQSHFADYLAAHSTQSS